MTNKNTQQVMAVSYFTRQKYYSPSFSERHETTMASEVNASENSGTGGSSIEEDGKTDVHILAKVQSLFGEAIYEALQSKKANKRTFVSSAFEDYLRLQFT